MRNMPDKLPQIWSDLGKPDGDWQKWDFPKPIDVLRQCVKRNPVTEAGNKWPPIRKDENFKTCLQNATN